VPGCNPLCQPLAGVRVVAQRAALEELATRHSNALWFAPDDLFIAGLRPDQVSVDDEHAIIEAEVGFSAMCFTPAQFAADVAPHIEWPVPVARPAFTQGMVAAVPCKLHFTDEGITVITNTVQVRDLEDRLGIRAGGSR
jgi:hypothetical protein